MSLFTVSLLGNFFAAIGVLSVLLVTFFLWAQRPPARRERRRCQAEAAPWTPVGALVAGTGARRVFVSIAARAASAASAGASIDNA